jgi:hypothetical protein
MIWTRKDGNLETQSSFGVPIDVCEVEVYLCFSALLCVLCVKALGFNAKTFNTEDTEKSVENHREKTVLQFAAIYFEAAAVAGGVTNAASIRIIPSLLLIT